MASRSDWTGAVELPAAVRRALAREHYPDIADIPSRTPALRFARGFARLQLGRFSEGKEDLEVATRTLPSLRDEAALAVACAQRKEPGGIDQALATANLLSHNEMSAPYLRARAEHVAGLCLTALRRNEEALRRLLRARALFDAGQASKERAEVFDAIGVLHASQGRSELAAHNLARSLAEKAVAGHRREMAVTLGNLGRLSLQVGRYREARAYFELDLQIHQQVGDRRTQARILNDLGRAQIEEGRNKEAQKTLREARTLARSEGLPSVEAFIEKDLAQRALNVGERTEARTHLDAARALLDARTSDYQRQVIRHVEGRLLVLEGEPGAVEALSEAVEWFADAELPDLEIQARLDLAGALFASGDHAGSERCLLLGMKRARARGLVRHFAPLNEALARHNLAEGVREEVGRRIGDRGEAGPGGYQLLERLAFDRRRSVYRAYDLTHGEQVVLKSLRLTHVYDPRTRRRMIDAARMELEAASRVNHPGVVRVRAVGVDEHGDPYVVQELVEGTTLRAFMRREHLAWPRIVGYLSQIAFALEALHEAGVVHRDLKPDNVMMRPDGRPVLIDFGGALLQVHGEMDAIALGTPPYMSPEQARGQKVDARSDLYALGVIAYEWLAGRAFVEPDSSDPGHAATPLSRLHPTLPSSLTGLVDKLLSRRKRSRPARAATVARRLLACRDAST